MTRRLARCWVPLRPPTCRAVALLALVLGLSGAAPSFPPPPPQQPVCAAYSAACTAKLIRDLTDSYSNTSSADGRVTAATRAVDKFLVQCLNARPSGLRPLNPLIVTQYNNTATSVLGIMQATSGWQNKPTVLSSSRLVAEVTSNAQRNLTTLYDLAVFNNKYMADMSRSGLFMDLTDAVQADPRIAWADIMSYFRDTAAYAGRIMAVPLEGVTFTLFYRRDVLAAANVTEPPYIWEDVVTLAERFNNTDLNGDGKPDYSVCHVLSAFCQAPHILLDIATNIVQVYGAADGAQFDPLTMQPLVRNPGFIKSLRIYRQLAALNPVYTKNWQDFEGTCNQGINAFLRGECLFIVQSSQVLKGTALRGTWPKLKGNIGSVMVPGFAEVYDRQTKQLVPCTQERCPSAIQRRLLNGSTAWVNYAPWKGTGGFSAMVASYVPPDYQQAGVDFCAIGLSTNITWSAVLNPANGNAPLRESMVTSSDALQRFLAQGYDERDTRDWLAVTRQTLGFGNVVIASGLPNPDGYQALYEAAAMNITYRSPYATPETVNLTSGWNVTEEEVADLLDQGLRDLMASQGPLSLLKSYYYASIGRALESAPPPPSGGGGGGNGTGGGGSSGDGESGGPSATLLAAAIVPSVVVGVGGLVLVGVVLAQLQRTRKKSLTGKTKPPGLGPDTTLLVTDVENSTSLFEELEPDVMDQAMAVHNALMRQLCLKHSGYEHTTEGDSFLLAFHTPRDAVMFAADLQVQLMACAWPQELLEHPQAASVWVSNPQQLASTPTKALTRGPMSFNGVGDPASQHRARSGPSSASVFHPSRGSHDASTAPGSGVVGGMVGGASGQLDSDLGGYALSRRAPSSSTAGGAHGGGGGAGSGALARSTSGWATSLRARLTEASRLRLSTAGSNKVQNLSEHTLTSASVLHVPEFRHHAQHHGPHSQLSGRLSIPPPASGDPLRAAATTTTSSAGRHANGPQHAQQHDAADALVADEHSISHILASPFGALATTAGGAAAQPASSGEATPPPQLPLPPRAAQVLLHDLSAGGAAAAVEVDGPGSAQPGGNTLGQRTYAPLPPSPPPGAAQSPPLGSPATAPEPAARGLGGGSQGSGSAASAAAAGVGGSNNVEVGGFGSLSAGTPRGGDGEPAAAADATGVVLQLPAGAAGRPFPAHQLGTVHEGSLGGGGASGAVTAAEAQSPRAAGGGVVVAASAPLHRLQTGMQQLAMHLAARAHTAEGAALAAGTGSGGGASNKAGSNNTSVHGKSVSPFVHKAFDTSYDTLPPLMGGLAGAGGDAGLAYAAPMSRLGDGPGGAQQGPGGGLLVGVGVGGGGVEPCTLAEHLERSSPLEIGGGPARVQIFRGLRVRIGMHTGLTSSDAIAYNRQAGRVQYAGPAMSMARVVQAAACGGMSLMSETTNALLHVESLQSQLIIGHEGEHLLLGTPKGVLPDNARRARLLDAHVHGPEELDAPPVNLYSVLPRALIYRAPRMAGSLRTLRCMTPGYLAAPFGSAAICFTHVVGLPSLKEWSQPVLEESLALYRAIACQLLMALGGYLMEAVDGLVLVAFPRPAQAIRWALGLVDACLEASWPRELLEHELGEEVAIQRVRQHSTLGPGHLSGGGVGGGPAGGLEASLGSLMVLGGAGGGAGPQAEASVLAPFATAASQPNLGGDGGGAGRTLLFRGLRIKCGIDFGPVSVDLNPTTGRVAFRGRCMNRASRVMSVAKTGQVWASADAWADARLSVNEPAEGYGVLPHALSMLRVRYGKAAPPDPLVARAEVELAACTGRQVHANELPPQRLKGIHEEVHLVALTLGNGDDMMLVAAKDTVPAGGAMHAALASRRHSCASHAAAAAGGGGGGGERGSGGSSLASSSASSRDEELGAAAAAAAGQQQQAQQRQGTGLEGARVRRVSQLLLQEAGLAGAGVVGPPDAGRREPRARVAFPPASLVPA